jgi:hypothetical protein
VRESGYRIVADISNELIYEVLKSVQFELARVDGKVDEVRLGMQALGPSQNAIRQEIIGIHEEILGVHATLVRHEARLDRIDRRLELSVAPAR